VKVVCLPGDGIGPEVMAAAREVLAVLAPDLELEDRLFGGGAIPETGTPLPDETLEACKGADAVLLGAVGLPQLDAADVRPEQGEMRLRRELDVYA
jgi:3-isopropylmalate dehydrogenase